MTDADVINFDGMVRTLYSELNDSNWLWLARSENSALTLPKWLRPAMIKHCIGILVDQLALCGMHAALIRPDGYVAAVQSAS